MFDYKELRWRRTSLQAASVSELVSEGVDSRVVYDAHLGCRAVGRCATVTFFGACLIVARSKTREHNVAARSMKRVRKEWKDLPRRLQQGPDTNETCADEQLDMKSKLSPGWVRIKSEQGWLRCIFSEVASIERKSVLTCFLFLFSFRSNAR